MRVESKSAEIPEEVMRKLEANFEGFTESFKDWRKKIEVDVRDPDFSIDVYTFLTWAEIFKFDNDLELARIALKRAETCEFDDLFALVLTGDYILDLLDDRGWASELYNRAERELTEGLDLCRLAGSIVKGLDDKSWTEAILKKALEGPCDVEGDILAANIYANNLGMYETAEEIIEETVIPLSAHDFQARLGVAEFYATAKYDAMMASEFYRDALALVETLKQRCQMAISVKEHFSEDWSHDIYRHSVESFLEEPDFEGLLDIMDELEILDSDLADENHGTLIELADDDPEKLEKLLDLEWWED